MPQHRHGIHWLSAGPRDTGRPSLLFIHGAGGNAAIWWQQFEAFAATRHVIAYDLRGFGRSSPHTAGDVGEQMVAAAVDVLTEAGATCADVVCQSLGGWSGVRLALARPDLVNRLVLGCTLAGIAHPPGLAAFRAAREKMDERGPASLGLTPDFEAAEPAKALVYRQVNAFNPPPDPAVGRRLFASDFLVPPASLTALVAPTLLLMGENDPIWPPDSLTGMLAAAPAASERVIAAAGHSPYFEQPDAFNAALRDFLD